MQSMRMYYNMKTMNDTFVSMLAEGGKKNTTGRAGEVVEIVLADQSRLKELYHCLFNEDAWLRMRAIDALEKVCRVRPEWLEPYIDRLLGEVAAIQQASIHWHLAEIFTEVKLTPSQLQNAINLLKSNISTNDVDWIVASNTMNTLTRFVIEGVISESELIPLLEIQQTHHSKAVVKRATRLLTELQERTS